MPASVSSQHALDIQRGERFAFGENWARFLAVLDDARIEEACRSLKEMLGVESLAGRSFLDVGNGSGLFSLAAMRLGAARVVSFDFDPSSVACAEELKRRYFPGALHWTIGAGSVLDEAYLGGLGQFDVVYSWGVLHHTGQMWRALTSVVELVRPGGSLFIAIYRDQGWRSRAWLRIKQLYNRGPVGRVLVWGVFCSYYAVGGLLADLARLRNPWRRYREMRGRGMSRYRDWIDWIGGLPFEVATAPQIFKFYKARGFRLENMTISDGHGCSEFVFSRPPEPTAR
jgi:SAM-dependent methyltransferase